MIKIGSFPYLIDDVLGELEMAAQIRIDCIAVSETDLTPNDMRVMVVAVNGMEKAWQYLHLIEHLKTKALARFREVIPQIDPGDLDTFIDQALRRIRRMACSVIIIEYDTCEKVSHRETYWSFGQMQCFLEDVESYDPLVYLDAMGQTSRYAWIYYLEMKRLEERIGSFAGAMLTLPVKSPAEEKNITGQKIMLNCTVGFLGALVRVACDRGLIDRPNVSGLCRWIAENFSTIRQENLSPRSIRNHFDDPSPEMLEKVEMELQVWQKYSESLGQQQRR
jgi:hypothetical protein